MSLRDWFPKEHADELQGLFERLDERVTKLEASVSVPTTDVVFPVTEDLFTPAPAPDQVN